MRQNRPRSGLHNLPMAIRDFATRPLRAALLAGLTVGLGAALAVEAASVTLGRNLHAVVPGLVYRSGQLSGPDLRRVVRKYGVYTVVNLRGCAPTTRWYAQECRATHRLGISQEDVALAANRLPSTSEVRRLVSILDRTEYPILLHCRQGADRTGLAAAVFALLQPGVTLEQARHQLGPRYGHVPAGNAGWLDQFLDLYVQWLAARNQSHTPTAFRQWLELADCPGRNRCAITMLEAPALLRRGEPAVYRVRIRNTGLETWRLLPDSNAGHHCVFVVTSENTAPVASGRFGRYESAVGPGESVDIRLVVPPLGKSGRYRLLVDMADERHCWFHQTGGEPLETELHVHD